MRQHMRFARSGLAAGLFPHLARLCLALLLLALVLPGCGKSVREQAVARTIDGETYICYPADSVPRQLRPLDEALPAWMRVLNIDTRGQAVWVLIGVLGQLAYFGRMGVQWAISEKRGESTVPPIFWWLSLSGASLLLLYGIWRQDIVWIMGQSFGWIVYTRNLMLLKKSKARQATPLVDPAPEPEPNPRRLKSNED